VKAPNRRLDGITVDTTTASREELIAEIERLNAVLTRWEQTWHQIVEANTAAWVDYINQRDLHIAELEQQATEMRKRIAALEKEINGE